MNKITQIALGTTALLLSLNARAAMNSFVASGGGQCSSKGSWTQNALEQANVIAETVANLRDDPNCKSLAASLGKANFTPDISNAPEAQDSYRAETIMSELQALRTTLGQTANRGGAKILNPILAQTALQSMTDVAGASTTVDRVAATKILSSRFQQASGRGLDMLNSLFTTLPQYQECLQARPDLAGSLFVGGVRMAAAFASGSQGISPKFAQVVGNFLNYLQDSKFNAITKTLNKQKFWTELSCLFETTQANYCAVQDGFELLKSQKSQSGALVHGGALEGYYIMSREVPEVSNWIRKIQMGIEPRLTTDAQFKKDTWTSIVRLYSNTYDLPAIYFENYNTVYKNLITVDQKQNNIRRLISRLADTITNSNDNDRTANFFTNAINPSLIPFFLIGREKVPREVIAAGANKIQPDDYMLDLDLVPELRNPDDVMNKIIVRLRELMDRAMVTGAEYFRNRMSVDQINLVDDSITSTAVSSRQSLLNIRNYLQSLYGRLRHEPEAQPMLASIADTVSRIDRILHNFDLVDQEAKKLDLKIVKRGYSLGNLSNYDGEERKQVTAAFGNVILSVYLQFNILLQRDSFFSTRLGTYVRMDYTLRARHEDFSQYTNALLITAGRNVLDRLQEYQKFNIAEAESDLSSANVINMSNLDQLENLAIGHVEDYLIDLNKRAGHSFVIGNDPNMFRWNTLFSLTGQKMTYLAAKQDRNNEAENVRAKVCVQTLGFKRFRHFVDLCKGAQLRSTLVASGGASQLPLTVDYNKLFLQRVSGDSLVNTLTNTALMPAENRFSQVCSLRDYFRNNLVAWMTRDSGIKH